MVTPSLLTVVLSAALFVLLGLAWVKGYDFMRKHSPENLPKFYIALAVIRLLVILTFAAGYILIVSSSEAESKAFALMLLLMYGAMMVVSLAIRH